jgi:hypothetical protein
MVSSLVSQKKNSATEQAIDQAIAGIKQILSEERTKAG